MWLATALGDIPFKGGMSLLCNAPQKNKMTNVTGHVTIAQFPLPPPLAVAIYNID